ncbi:MAG TPA: proton-conducting transporter membrane subunit [Symbiobacteriaceae bacterium]|nr:proton-conducting transporter membrane subunit [Symbiobacteriaceae bacterium]
MVELLLLLTAALAAELPKHRWSVVSYALQGAVIAVLAAAHSPAAAALALVGRALIIPLLLWRYPTKDQSGYPLGAALFAGAAAWAAAWRWAPAVAPSFTPAAAILLAVGTWAILAQRRTVLGICLVENGVHLALPSLGLSAESGLFIALILAVWLLLSPQVRSFALRGAAPAALILTTAGFSAALIMRAGPLVLLTTGLCAAAIAYARYYLKEHEPLIYLCMPLFAGAICWAALTEDLIWLYVAVELSTLASAPVIALRSRAAACKYLLMNILGLTAALCGLGLIYAAAGSTRIADMGAMPPGAGALAGALLLVGLGTKAGLVPVHGWLPDAYEHCPGGFTPLFAGVGTKVALLALIRLLPPLIGSAPALAPVTVVLACITMVVGVAAAFGQDDLRRLLAYSSVSQAGYILLGIGVGGLAAAQLHIINHGLLKAILFAVAAALPVTSIAQNERLTQKPWAAVVFLVAALGLGGVPPLPAFFSKFALFAAAARGGYGWAAGVAVGVSLLTITLLVRAGSRIFLTGGEKGGEHAHGVAAADD